VSTVGANDAVGETETEWCLLLVLVLAPPSSFGSITNFCCFLLICCFLWAIYFRIRIQRLCVRSAPAPRRTFDVAVDRRSLECCCGFSLLGIVVVIISSSLLGVVVTPASLAAAVELMSIVPHAEYNTRMDDNSVRHGMTYPACYSGCCYYCCCYYYYRLNCLF